MTRFNHEPSILYKETAEAIKKLIKEEGTDSIRTLFAEFSHKEKRDNFIYHFHVKETKLTPPQYEKIGSCMTSPPSGFDHTSTWSFIGSRKVDCIVTQPYHLDIQDLKGMIEFADRNHLEISIEPGLSWHYPSETVSIIFLDRERFKSFYTQKR